MSTSILLFLNCFFFQILHVIYLIGLIIGIAFVANEPYHEYSTVTALVVLSITLVVIVIGSGTIILLIYGAIEKRKKFILPWIIYECVLICLTLGLLIFSLIYSGDHLSKIKNACPPCKYTSLIYQDKSFHCYFSFSVISLLLDLCFVLLQRKKLKVSAAIIR